MTSSVKKWDYKTLLLVSCILFPKYPVYIFPLYMFSLYRKVMKSQRMFNLHAVPDELFAKILECNANNPFDCNNSIAVDDVYAEDLCGSDLVRMFVKNREVKPRMVNIFTCHLPQLTVLVSDTLADNLRNHGISDVVKLSVYDPSLLKIASEVCVSLIRVYDDISSSALDILLRNYFETPKILCKFDVITIDVKKFGAELFYINKQLNELSVVYFKCCKITFGETEDCTDCCICVSDKTCLKQSTDVQGLIPKQFKKIKSSKQLNLKESVIDKCPYGLQNYLHELEKATLPFINKRSLKLKPAFLIQAPRGIGAELVVEVLAAKLGVHFYKFSTIDIACHVYAQTEARLRTLFFRTKMAAPCVLLINAFENFGKNNEGQYDQRIINCFKNELDVLFELNVFPVILVCVSHTRNVHVDLKRSFLEVFTWEVPSQQERFEILKWLVEDEDLKVSVDLKDVAVKCNGFLYEDIKALLFYAKKSCWQEGENLQEELVLGDQEFTKAVDLMQSKYSQSLGAPKVPKVLWSDVGGLDDVKNEIIKTIQLPLQHPDFFETSGLRRSGILLYGPPGTGKTLIAKAVATECNLCFLAVKGPELLNMYVGQSEQNIREVFERARHASPCIIFFDELDSLAPNRGISGDSGGVMDRVVSQLLAEMDGLNESATLFIIGATNRPDLIDPALLRPGRFDKLLYVGPCTDVASKVSVLRALTKKFILAEDINLEEVVKVCPKNITGADFYGLCSNAWMSAVRKLINENVLNRGLLTPDNVIVTMEDFINAIKSVKPSVKAEDLHYFEKLKARYSNKR